MDENIEYLHTYSVIFHHLHIGWDDNRDSQSGGEQCEKFHRLNCYWVRVKKDTQWVNKFVSGNKNKKKILIIFKFESIAFLQRFKDKNICKLTINRQRSSNNINGKFQLDLPDSPNKADLQPGSERKQNHSGTSLSGPPSYDYSTISLYRTFKLAFFWS